MPDSSPGRPKGDGRTFLMMHPDAPMDPKLGNAAFRTLAALSRYRDNKTGKAYPSTYRLSRDLKKNQRAVQRDLMKLVELGYAIHDGWRGGVRIFQLPLKTIAPTSTVGSCRTSTSTANASDVPQRLPRSPYQSN
jgi:hypothetical protein